MRAINCVLLERDTRNGVKQFVTKGKMKHIIKKIGLKW